MNPIETIKLSQTAKDQLITLKRYTGHKQWNVLCRWAFCISLAEPSVPPVNDIPADSNVEMTWRVFGGPYHGLYTAWLKQRCAADGLDPNDPDVLASQFRLHLHRGISYLAGDKGLQTIADLIRKLPLGAIDHGNDGDSHRAP